MNPRARHLLALSLIALVPLASCTSKKADTGKKVLTWSISDDVKTFDPAAVDDSISSGIVPLSLESLYQYAYLKSPAQVEPLLAASLPTVSADGLTYTIKIKKGVRYQDDPAFPDGKGREVRAQDFIYAWKRLYLPKVASTGTWIFDEKIAGIDDLRKKMAALPSNDAAKIEEALASPFEGMKALDDQTIQIRLSRKYPQLVHVLTMHYTAPIPKEVTDKYGHDGLHDRLIGTGPFLLKSVVHNSRIIFVRNPNFRGEKYPSEGDERARAQGLLAAAGKDLPFLDEIVHPILKEGQPRWLTFLKGGLDIEGIPKDNFNTAIFAGELTPELKKKGIQLEKSDEPTIYYFVFNMKDKLVGSNADLRRAIVRTIDRDKWIELFLNGRGIKATSIVPPSIDGHTGRKEMIGDYNLEEAKRLLAKAGYPEGKGLPPIRFDLNGSDTTTRQQAEFIAQSVAKIGVKLEIITNTFPAFLEKEKNGALQFYRTGWGAYYPDAENFLQLAYGKNVSPGPNGANFVNAEYDRLYEKIAQMTPSPERTELIRKAEDILFGEGAWAMMQYPITYTLTQKWLKNYRASPIIANQEKYLDVDPVEKEKTLKEAF